MPLNLLVPALRRVNAASSSTQTEPHPLHALLEPILLTPRSTTNKYHIELPHILREGCGVGEIEETMMWYALTHVYVEDDSIIDEHIVQEGPWVNEKWRNGWLEKM